MHIKTRWLPYIVLILGVLLLTIVVIHENNKVSCLSTDELLLRFGRTKVGTFEATADNSDHRDASYKLHVQSGEDGEYYEIDPSDYRTFSFIYGDGDYEITLLRKDKASSEKDDYVPAGSVKITVAMGKGSAIVAANPFKTVFDTTTHYDAVWEMREYELANGKSMKYWINVPEGATSGMPIVLFLHGDGEMNNAKAVANLKPVKYMKEAKDYISIAPVGTNRDWVSDSVQQGLKGLLDKYISEYQIDVSRVYIWGFSRGAIGTWELVERYGSFFAAAMPISCGCRGGAAIDAGNFRNTKVRAFAGGQESTYITLMKAIVRKIVEAGGDATFETVPRQSHHTITANFPYGEAFQWLLAQ